MARTLTSATRVLDVMELLRVEDGIEKYYTVNPGSAFADGLHEYLVSVAGPRVLTWAEATRRTFQLAVACAVHPTMRRLDAPLMVMPHGAGYNRLVSESTGDATSPAGLSRRELTHRGKVIPAAIGVSHPDQLARLLDTCPEAVPRAEVIGDWCAQRIRDSEARRDCYRARFGVTDGRRLVVLHSTWSAHSLLGRHPGLPLDLVTALPADEYAVAAVFHPNVWARHTRADLLERLREPMDAGLMVIPPEEGWRAAIVACDAVIGDHGSTTFYSAAHDRPTLLAATGLAELDPASPAAAFATTAPRLDPSGDLHAQLLRAQREYDPGMLRPVVDSQLADVEKSGERTQRRLYAFLEHRGVPLPRQPPGPSPVPEPSPERGAPVLAYVVTGGVLPDGSVGVRRLPMVPGRGGRLRRGGGERLCGGGRLCRGGERLLRRRRRVRASDVVPERRRHRPYGPRRGPLPGGLVPARGSPPARRRRPGCPDRRLLRRRPPARHPLRGPHGTPLGRTSANLGPPPPGRRPQPVADGRAQRGGAGAGAGDPDGAGAPAGRVPAGRDEPCP
ncbi:hypothetical protein [Streptomyces sp. ST1015]|uniref:hypothetical protein n=1 Tax=unclassified Streptomyces TaxID=2593676 RepID=UPI00292F4FBD|nr:hypothetical protein [Streptomyces sp. ST1015]